MDEFWSALKQLCSLAGDIGDLPDDRASFQYDTEDPRVIGQRPLSYEALQEARAAWRFAKEKNPLWLHSHWVGCVFQHLGFFAGQRLGLSDFHSSFFADWLALTISGRYECYTNEMAVAALDQIAGAAACGNQLHVSRAYLGGEFWVAYQAGVKAVVDAIKYGFLDVGWGREKPI